MIPYLIATIVALIPLYGYLIMLLERAKTNIRVRNDLLSFAYLIRDIGPSVSSVSVVSLVIANDEDKLTLSFIFILGVIFSYSGRKLRDVIFTKTKQKNKDKSLTALAKRNLK